MDGKDNFFLSIPALIVAFSWVKFRKFCIGTDACKLPANDSDTPSFPYFRNMEFITPKNLNINPLNICSALFLMLFL